MDVINNAADRQKFNNHRRTKLTAPETISRSRDIVVPSKNFNGSRDLTTPLSGMPYHPGLAIATDNLPTKFEVSISTHYEDKKDDTKCRKWGGLA